KCQSLGRGFSVLNPLCQNIEIHPIKDVLLKLIAYLKKRIFEPPSHQKQYLLTFERNRNAEKRRNGGTESFLN
ncbi:MAG: hypothetical protein Q9P01_17145, partial [Anaerolineae bacterium]|nr:hypothetical protein [Anaerolineae bacterium]